MNLQHKQFSDFDKFKDFEQSQDMKGKVIQVVSVLKASPNSIKLSGLEMFYYVSDKKKEL